MLLHCCEKVLGIQEGKHLSIKSILSEKVLLASSLHRKTFCSSAVRYFLILTLSVVSERLSVSSPVCKAEHWEWTRTQLKWSTPTVVKVQIILNCCRLMSRLTFYPKMIHFHQANDHLSALQQCFSGSRGRLQGERKWEIRATEWTHKSPRAENARQTLWVPSGNESLHSVYNILENYSFF